MRKFKFRAWDIDNKNMIKFTDDDNWQMVYECGEICLCELDGDCETGRILHCIYKPREKYFDDCILMQYTGLKDKNGKEIYEGDIFKWVERNNFNQNYICVGSVKFKYGSFTCHNENTRRPSSERANIEDMEIIGNIWENPELMEEKCLTNQ